jgi:uncharacterized protein
MIYEWDESKLLLNLANHKVHFSMAEDFDWETAAIKPDNRKDYGEERFIAYGYINGRLYCLIFTNRFDKVRIISLRKANRREIIIYDTKTHFTD